MVDQQMNQQLTLDLQGGLNNLLKKKTKQKKIE